MKLISEDRHEGILFKKILQTKPEFKGMKKNFYDLF